MPDEIRGMLWNPNQAIDQSLLLRLPIANLDYQTLFMYHGLS
jgi:hypothetical protein